MKIARLCMELSGHITNRWCVSWK